MVCGPDVCRRRRTALSVSCPCLGFVRIIRKIVSGVCLLSGFCPDFLSGICLSWFCLSRFSPLSGFCPNFSKKLSVVCLSGRIRTRQSCPDFHCPCPPTSDVAHIINTSTTVNNSVLHKQLRYSQRIKSIAILMME